MANPNPSEKTRFKKGQSGNPKGKRKLPLDLRKVAELTADELQRTISKHFRMDKFQIAGVLQNPDSPALDLIIASTIAKAIKHGNINKAESLFLRCIGKVSDDIKITDVTFVTEIGADSSIVRKKIHEGNNS